MACLYVAVFFFACLSVVLAVSVFGGHFLLSVLFFFFFSSRRRHTRSVSAFLLNRSSDLFATRRTLFHVLVGCGLLMLKVSRLKLPVIWLLVSMWLNTLTKSQIWTLLLKV